MPARVSLKALVDELDASSDEATVYLNRSTGEFVLVTDEDRSAAERIDEGNRTLKDFPDWQHESIRIASIVNASDDYVSLPDKFDIHESEILRRFARSIEPSDVSAALEESLRGRGAFRRFKDAIHRFRIENHWYRFRAQALERIAIDWLNANEIPYVNDRH